MSCETLILNLPHQQFQGKIMTCPHWGSIITYGACISVCEKAQQWQQPGIAILILVLCKREWQMLLNAGESRQHTTIILPQWVFWLCASAWFVISCTRKVDGYLSLHHSLTGWSAENSRTRPAMSLLRELREQKLQRNVIAYNAAITAWPGIITRKLQSLRMRQHRDVGFSYFPFGINKFRCSAATRWDHVLRIFEALCRGEGPKVERE